MMGIYKITNLVNGKVYIGQAQDIEKRWREHKCSSKSNNQILYRAMRKHGFENFSFEILMLCEEDLLDLMEIYYIEMYRSYVGWEDNWGYNATTGGDIGVRGYKHTKESKEKMSKTKKERRHLYNRTHSEETKKKLSEIKKGKAFSEEHRKNISKSKSGENHPNWGKHHSEETIEKMRKAKQGKHHSEETKQKIRENHAKLSGGEHPSAKRVCCNKIIFSCVEECSTFYIKNRGTMTCWLSDKKSMPQEFQELGLRYATAEDISMYPVYNKKNHGEKINTEIYTDNKKRIFCNGTIFPSLKKCSIVYNEKSSSMCNWLKGTRKMPQKYIELGLRYATEEDINTYPLYDENIKH